LGQLKNNLKRRGYKVLSRKVLTKLITSPGTPSDKELEVSRKEMVVLDIS
jgi:hypothetical protein